LRKIATSSRKTLNAFAMKQIVPFLAVGLILFASCSSSRKAAQTPDDVYYSPGSSRGMVAAADDGDAGYYNNARSSNNGDYYSTPSSDNYVRMKAQDQARWSYFDDYNAYDSYYYPSAISPYYGMGFGYGYPMYGYGLSYGLGMGFMDPYFGWNSYFLWNTCYNPYFYNPYYGGGIIVVKGSSYNNNVYTHLRAFNGTSYRNSLTTRVTNSNNRVYRPAPNAYTRELNGSSNRFYSTQSSNRGTYYRPATSSGNNGYNNNSYSRPSSSGFGGSQPVRSFSPAPSGGGGGGGGVRPSRH